MMKNQPRKEEFERDNIGQMIGEGTHEAFFACPHDYEAGVIKIFRRKYVRNMCLGVEAKECLKCDSRYNPKPMSPARAA